jgi:hypothetical protein
MVALGVLQIRLAGEQFIRADGRRRRLQLCVTGPEDRIGGLIHRDLGPVVILDRPGQRLTGCVLCTLAQCTHAFERKAKGGAAHDPVIGRLRRKSSGGASSFRPVRGLDGLTDARPGRPAQPAMLDT